MCNFVLAQVITLRVLRVFGHFQVIVMYSSTIIEYKNKKRSLLENFHIYTYILFTFYVSKYTHCIPIYKEVF